LEHYNIDLTNRPYLVVANKIDLPDSQENVKKLVEKFGDKAHLISAVTGEGISELIDKVYELLQSIPEEAKKVAGAEAVVRKFKEPEPFIIKNVNGVYEISGKRIEKLVAMTNFDYEEGLQRFQQTIIKMGLEDALREQGIKEGDTVKIKDLEFTYSK